MAVVRRFFLIEDDDIQMLRPHNTVDWVLLERRKSIKEELTVLNERWRLAKTQELEAQQGSEEEE